MKTIKDFLVSDKINLKKKFFDVDFTIDESNKEG